MLALYEVLGRGGHVVSQVVETVFVVRTEGDVGQIGLATRLRVGLVLVDAVDRQSVELVHRAHPLRVSASQIVVHRHHVDTFTGQCVQEYGKGCHQGLTLTGSHLGDFTQMQCDTAEELDIVVDHVPLHVVSAGHPVCGVDGLVSVDGDEIFGGRQVAVEIVGRYDDRFILGETAGRIFHDGECFRQHLIQFLLDLFVDSFLRLVNILRDLLLFRKRGLRKFQPGFLLGDMCFIRSDEVGDLAFQAGAPLAQFIVRECFDLGIYGLDLVKIRLDEFTVFVGLGAEEELD